MKEYSGSVSSPHPRERPPFDGLWRVLCSPEAKEYSSLAGRRAIGCTIRRKESGPDKLARLLHNVVGDDKVDSLL